MNATAPRRARTRRLAWTLALVAVALEVGCVVFALASDASELSRTDPFAAAIAVAFAIVGALVASRQPRNAIGWIFLGVALSTALSGLAHSFVEFQLADGPDQRWPVGAAAAFSDVGWIPFVLVPATVLLLLFPDGQLVSRRWRFVARFAIAGIILGLLTGGAAEPLQDYPTVNNPFAIDSWVMESLTGLSAPFHK